MKRPASSRKKPVKKAAKPARKRQEKGLQYRCQQWLEHSGIWNRLLIFHVANERRGGFGTHVHFKRMGVRPGVADYLAFPPGRSVAIELKDQDGDQDDDQERFERQWQAAGNAYFIARTLEEFQGIIHGITLFA